MTAAVTAGEAAGWDPAREVLTQAAATFGLLSAPMRLHIVWLLAHGECDVTRLADRVGGAVPAVSQHLARLKLAGLVHSRREGRRQLYAVDDPRVVQIVRLMVDGDGDGDALDGPAAGQAVPRAASERPSGRVR